MKKITIFIVLALLCLKFSSKAQFIDTRTIPQLELGAKVPEAFWTNSHLFYQAGNKTKGDLSKFKNRIIILDFWASWCGSCLKKLPILDSLQKVYPDDILVLPVVSTHAHDKFSKIEQIFSGQRKPFSSLSIPTVLEDSKLWELFPHHQLSHVVWIQDGRVLAMTGGDFISASVIDKLVKEDRAIKLKQAGKSR